jgi:probable F420-dependent oxidoreductase
MALRPVTSDGVLVCVRPPGWVKDGSEPLADFLGWVEQAERLGFDGVFVGDRMLAEATSPGGAVVYGASMVDATVLLASMAARTERIFVGPLVLVFPYRHPIQLAKQFGSLDAASGGRLILGAGIGWNEREFVALGIPMAGRAERFEEQLDLVRRLWAGGSVTATGPTWRFDAVQVSPLPARPGGPPVWMASFAPSQPLDWTDTFPPLTERQLQRVGRLADGWVPLVYSAAHKRRLGADALAAAWRLVLDSAERHGRSRGDIDFVYADWCYVLDGPGAEEKCREALARFFSGTWEEALRTYTIGTADEVLDRIRHHTRAIDAVDGYILTPLGDDVGQLALLSGVAESLRAGRPS